MAKNQKINHLLTEHYFRTLLSPDENEKRTIIIRNLEKLVFMYKNTQLQVIGSSAYGLNTVNGDIDVVCLAEINKENDERSSQANVLIDLSSKLKDSEFSIENTLLSATFPIIKLRHKMTNLRIDMSVNQYGAMENTTLISNILLAYPAIKQVIVLAKCICSIFEINSSYICTLSSYSITLMVIFYFQMINEIPHLLSARKKVNYKHFDLFENLKGFFFYYGWIFSYVNDVVSIRTGRPMKKSSTSFRIYNSKYNLVFCIEDPIVSDFNVTRTVNEVSLVRIVKTFRLVYYMLSKHDLGFLKQHES